MTLSLAHSVAPANGTGETLVKAITARALAIEDEKYNRMVLGCI